jgi:hypothetical protein
MTFEHVDKIGAKLDKLSEIDKLKYCTITLMQPIIRGNKEIYFKEFLNSVVTFSEDNMFVFIYEYFFDKEGREEFVLEKISLYPMSEIQNISLKQSSIVHKYLQEHK